MKQKIEAFTLMEVTVAMLLSAICITICYTAYTIVSGYYKEFNQKNEASAVVLSLKQVLEKDFFKSKYVVRNENEITVLNDSTTINYVFNENWITRNLNQLHTDTFKLKSTALNSYFENNEVLNADTIDKISFNVILPKQLIVPIQINKVYSAENLFN